MAAQKRPHHALTLEKKVEIINDFESGSFTKTALATKHAIPKSSLTRILHDKEKLRAAFSSSRFGAQRKRLRLGNHEELEKCLVLWLRRARSQNLPINGPIIRAKAEEFVLQLGIEGFSCSEGWFTRFKERNGLVFRAVSGESAAVDVSACQNWQAGRLPEILREYKPQDIYNVDETALFFKLLPTKSLSFKGERCTLKLARSFFNESKIQSFFCKVCQLWTMSFRGSGCDSLSKPRSISSLQYSENDCFLKKELSNTQKAAILCFLLVLRYAYKLY